MTSYMSKDQWIFDFSVHDPFNMACHIWSLTFKNEKELLEDFFFFFTKKIPLCGRGATDRR